MPAQFAADALELHPGAEIHPLGSRRRQIGGRIDDRHPFEPLAQEAHAPVDFVQALFAVGVLGVLGAIALRGGLGHRLGDARPFFVPQLVELILAAAWRPPG